MPVIAPGIFLKHIMQVIPHFTMINESIIALAYSESNLSLLQYASAVINEEFSDIFCRVIKSSWLFLDIIWKQWESAFPGCPYLAGKRLIDIQECRKKQEYIRQDIIAGSEWLQVPNHEIDMFLGRKF